MSSFSEYLPSLRYSIFVVLPVNVVDFVSPRASPPLILTPASEPSVSLAVSVNSAAPSVISLPPRSVLLMLSIGASSTISLPLSSTYALPVVTADTSVTLPSFTVNVKSLTTEKPVGAVSSLRVYVPSLRPMNVATLPSNSEDLTPSASSVPSLMLTPLRSVSSPAISVNLALPASSGIGVPPRACLSSTIVFFFTLRRLSLLEALPLITPSSIVNVFGAAFS